MGLPVIDLHSSRLIISKCRGMIEIAGVNPNPLCIPSPCPLQRIRQQRTTETTPDEVRRQAEVGDLDRLRFISSQFIVACCRTTPRGNKGPEPFGIDISLPLMVTPRLLVDPLPLLADQQIEGTIETPFPLDCLAHDEIRVGQPRRHKLFEGVHLEVGCNDFSHDTLILHPKGGYPAPVVWHAKSAGEDLFGKRDGRPQSRSRAIWPSNAGTGHFQTTSPSTTSHSKPPFSLSFVTGTSRFLHRRFPCPVTMFTRHESHLGCNLAKSGVLQ